MGTNSLYAGQVIYAWTIARIDETGKRATCLCACGAPAQLSVASLASGDCSKGCGCKLTPGPRPWAKAPSFASDIADAGSLSAPQRKARGQE